MSNDCPAVSNAPLTLNINGENITADMDAWRRVQKQISDRLWADRQAWQEAQRRAGQVWYALFWRYGSAEAEEFFDREEAARFLDDGDLAEYGIREPDGSITLTSSLRQDPTHAKAAYWERALREAGLLDQAAQ